MQLDKTHIKSFSLLNFIGLVILKNHDDKLVADDSLNVKVLSFFVPLVYLDIYYY